jgi:galactose-1-phosphate uridylyltransferase
MSVMTWEERWHPLREEWVIVAAHRQNRPWDGEVIEHEKTPLPAYVTDCYLCPGNLRVSGQRNNQYTRAFVFDNDHPCVGFNALGFHFHVEFHPPLRRPNLLKYLAGPEIGGGNFLSDTTPEEKAAELRAQPDVHYKRTKREKKAGVSS